MNKKGFIGLSMVEWFGVMIGVLIVGIVMTSLVGYVLDPFSAGIGNVSVKAGQEVKAIQTHFYNWFDFVIVMVVVVSIILLLLSSFMIDVHPFFIVLYIITGFVTFALVPSALTAVDALYAESAFIGAIPHLPFTDFIRANLIVIGLGVFVLTGIVMYGKVKLLGGGQSI